MGAHPLAPGRDRAGEALGGQLARARSRARGELTITSWAPVAGCERNRSARPPGGGAERIDRAREPDSGPVLAAPALGLGLGEDRVEVRDRALPPPRACPGAPPPGRFAQTSGGVRSSRPSQNGQLSAASGRGSAGRRVEGVGALGAARREDRPQAGELVDADLRGAQLLGRRAAARAAAAGRGGTGAGTLGVGVPARSAA